MRIALTCLTVVFAALLAKADTMPSPDGRFSVKTGSTIEVVDSAGQTVLLLDKNTTGVNQIEVSWSPDSRRVVVAENLRRGSSVLAAWHDGLTWHKTLQLDADQAGIIRQVQGSGRLIAEGRSLGDWISEDEITVKGGLAFSDHRIVPYEYTLEFVAGPAKLDRGGYEEGVLKGRDYRIMKGP